MATLFRKILVPYDFSPSSVAALAVAVDLAVKYDGTLLVMHALPPILPTHGRTILPPADEIATVGAALAADVARAVKRRRLRRVRSWVMIGPPAGCILDASGKVDAIVMGTLGRTGLPHLLIGSVAERVVRHATVPVLTIRARRRRAR